MMIKTATTSIALPDDYQPAQEYLRPEHEGEDRQLTPSINHVLRIAVAAVDLQNAQRLAAYRKSLTEDNSDGVTEASMIEPDLPRALPIEHITAVLDDGSTRQLVVLVTSSVHRTAYQLAAITHLGSETAIVQLSGWDSYDSPLIAGPWIWFSENFDTSSTLGHVQWAKDSDADWFQRQAQITVKLKISTGLPALDNILGGGFAVADRT